MKTFQTLSAGNLGALSFLMQLASPEIPIRTVAKVEQSGIVGTDLYVMWSDICDKDMTKVVNLLDKCPNDLLKDACSRQDYSGKKLVAEYL